MSNRITKHQYVQAKKCLDNINKKGDKYNEKKYYLEVCLTYETQNNMLTVMGEKMRMAEIASL